MTIAQKIEVARRYLREGNRDAYVRIMAGNLRAVRSAKAEAAIRAAIEEDGAESFL